MTLLCLPKGRGNDYRAGWLRFWHRGPGISWTQEPPLFSERIGLRKPFMVVRGWRFHWLRRGP